MNVLHISFSDLRGGAARAAFRLHQGLRRAGVDSRMLVREKISDDPCVETALPRHDPAQASRERRMSAIQRRLIDAGRTPLSDTCFTLPYLGLSLLDLPPVRRADVLHLHWTAYFLNPLAAAELGRRKPVVWTLHDCHPMAGGCHYPAGCREFLNECKTCPQLKTASKTLPRAVFADKAEAWSGFAPLVIAPSRWLADLASASPLLSRARVEHVPNGVDTDLFRLGARPALKERLGLERGAFLVLHGADQGGEKRKGFAHLLRALESLQGTGAVLGLFGDMPEQETPIPALPLGFVRDETRLSEIYGAADVFALPSLEDNLPNTMLEAMACGTPVAAYATGGIPEAVRDRETGRLAPAGDAPALGRVLWELSRDPEALRALGRKARETAEAEYSLERQARRMAALYASLAPDGSGVFPPRPSDGAEPAQRQHTTVPDYAASAPFNRFLARYGRRAYPWHRFLDALDRFARPGR